MSLGNVSSPRSNETYFRQALEYLRAAKNIEDFRLPSPLEQYLEDYGVVLEG
ncbi:hypothetical protein BU24DRAFT_427885 [Aaosphaeria arxii CBS 175.79]|uniref:Uncharacterized protein n=1 Tax=Aaosphaeria arxii CBS 175.79 TaxID=1450172 RepID=A0A6A5X9X2_9PLEO|nr:uncharacterized protein BU24DRAFT_427885 [Aaosphaeria arxii CBS 175.79]KAF2009855.1 hypothetical protein BU24DRAFT_427885 [Aaosphaeria arxii CBS 175.79]